MQVYTNCTVCFGQSRPMTCEKHFLDNLSQDPGYLKAKMFGLRHINKAIPTTMLYLQMVLYSQHSPSQHNGECGSNGGA